MDNVLITINPHSFWTWFALYVSLIPVAGVIISALLRRNAKEGGKFEEGDACKIFLCGSTLWPLFLITVLIILIGVITPSVKSLDEWLNGV